MKIYVVMDNIGNWSDVGYKLSTAKQYATVYGWPIVGVRQEDSDSAQPLFGKQTNGRWVAYQCHHKIDINN